MRTDNPSPLNEQDSAIIQRADTEAPHLWPAVVQLFLWEDYPQSSPRPIGSGVLVRVNEAIFIFSAAHVLASFKNKLIWTGSEDHVAPLPGQHRFSLTGRLEMGDHQTDPLDAAVASLPAGSPHNLTAHALDASAIDTANSNGEEARYLLLGHPANRTGIDRQKKEVQSERKPLVFSEVREADYTEMGYDRRTHLLLRWRKQWKNVKGEHGARDLHGSSGGGIWRFDPLTNSKPQLVATFTELKTVKGGKVLVGTRIRIHLGLAAGCCAIPEPRRSSSDAAESQ